jgi:hypothetical protein
MEEPMTGNNRFNDRWQLYRPTSEAEIVRYYAALQALETGWEVAKALPSEAEARRYMEAIMEQHADAGAADSEGFQELEYRIEHKKTHW